MEGGDGRESVDGGGSGVSTNVDVGQPVQQTLLNLSWCRYSLLDPQIGGNWYLGDRFYRQIYGGIASTNDPPVQVSKIPRQVFNYYAQYGWEQGSRFLSEAPKELYEQYWVYVSGGPTLPPIGRGVNIDVVGYEALVGQEVEIPFTPQDVLGGVYNTQGGSSSSQDLTLDWNYTICTATRETIQLHLPRDRPSIEALALMTHSRGQWRNLYIDAMNCTNQLKYQLFMHSADMAQQLKEKDRQLMKKDTKIERLHGNSQSCSEWPSLDDN